MKQVRGFWLPDHEEHLITFIENGPEFAGGPTYQLHKLMLAMPHIKNFGHAIDIGAHCGLWTRVLAQMFTKVSAFEPVETHLRCLQANCPFAENVMMWNLALGNMEAPVSLHTGPASSGDTYVKEGGEHTANMVTLDFMTREDGTYSDWFGRIDFIKIDCEGFENFIVQGGEKTIKKWRPVIIVEQKPGKGHQFGIDDQAAVKLLASWGALKMAEYAGDYIMAWR